MNNDVILHGLLLNISLCVQHKHKIFCSRLIHLSSTLFLQYKPALHSHYHRWKTTNNQHPTRGGSSRLTAISLGWPRTARGQNWKFCLLACLQTHRIYTYMPSFIDLSPVVSETWGCEMLVSETWGCEMLPLHGWMDGQTDIWLALQVISRELTNKLLRGMCRGTRACYPQNAPGGPQPTTYKMPSNLPKISAPIFLGSHNKQL